MIAKTRRRTMTMIAMTMLPDMLAVMVECEVGWVDGLGSAGMHLSVYLLWQAWTSGMAGVVAIQ